MSDSLQKHEENDFFKKLYSFKNHFLNIARGYPYGINREDAQNIFQESVCKYHSKLNSGEIKKYSGPGKAHALLLKIFKEKLVDFIRRKNTYEKILNLMPDQRKQTILNEAESECIDEQKKAYVEDLLCILEKEERMVIELKFMKGLKSAEIMLITGINCPETVRWIIWNAKNKMKEYAINILGIKLWALLAFLGLTELIDDFAEFPDFI